MEDLYCLVNFVVWILFLIFVYFVNLLVSFVGMICEYINLVYCYYYFGKVLVECKVFVCVYILFDK